MHAGWLRRRLPSLRPVRTMSIGAVRVTVRRAGVGGAGWSRVTGPVLAGRLRDRITGPQRRRLEPAFVSEDGAPVAGQFRMALLQLILGGAA